MNEENVRNFMQAQASQILELESLLSRERDKNVRIMIENSRLLDGFLKSQVVENLKKMEAKLALAREALENIERLGSAVDHWADIRSGIFVEDGKCGACMAQIAIKALETLDADVPIKALRTVDDARLEAAEDVIDDIESGQCTTVIDADIAVWKKASGKEPKA